MNCIRRLKLNQPVLKLQIMQSFTSNLSRVSKVRLKTDEIFR